MADAASNAFLVLLDLFLPLTKLITPSTFKELAHSDFFDLFF